MDIKDTKSTKLQKLPPDRGFQAVEFFQKDLVDSYIKIEGLPLYPVNLDIKSNQLLMKDFIARITEELGEGYESLESVLSKIRLNGAGGTIDSRELYYEFFNIYEEIADALHFFMEALIYAGISPGNVKDFIAGYYHIPEEDIWKGLRGICREWVLNKYTFFTLDAAVLIDIQSMADPSIEDIGGIANEVKVTRVYPLLSWEVTYHLQLARNALKNKPWKQSQMVSDRRVFGEEMLKAYAWFIGLTTAMGLDSANLLALYIRKNHINWFRIRSKY